MKNLLFLIIATLLYTGCTPVDKNQIAVCGDGEVKIIDLAESDGTRLKEVWRCLFEQGKARCFRPSYHYS